MGFEVAVEDERGAKLTSLDDPTNVINRILPSDEDQNFQCLNRIDWYGNTIFNRYQIPVFRQELQRISGAQRSHQEMEMIERLDALAAAALAEPHLYLKFYGD